MNIVMKGRALAAPAAHAALRSLEARQSPQEEVGKSWRWSIVRATAWYFVDLHSVYCSTTDFLCDLGQISYV